jgi:serine/threonine-protein kinase HipA
VRRSADVLLNDLPVGRLTRDDAGRVSFRLLADYQAMAERPVLSQSYEDDPSRIYRGKHGELPAYFANLVPEGPLRNLIEASLQLPSGDEIALLEAVGQDLPGAVVIQPAEAEAETLAEDGLDDAESASEAPRDEGGLRFSLAGVQLKFSVLREHEKLTLPVRGQRGDWIVKLDSSRFSHVVENEFTTLEWARAAGFEVPECHLDPVSVLAPALRRHAAPDSLVLVIRRYDREGERRIHQEDFAQVVHLPPRLKYDQITYEQCVRLVKRIVGEEAAFEIIRRLAFVLASGNNDAHLKNWSLLYPDGINAVLAPLYDQVATVAWPELAPVLSLKLAGRKRFAEMDEAAFEALADKAGLPRARALAVLREGLERIAVASKEVAWGLLPAAHREALRAYWQAAPLLRPYRELFDRAE